eukprot:3715184-Pyramimonas_sp.AAC.1
MPSLRLAPPDDAAYPRARLFPRLIVAQRMASETSRRTAATQSRAVMTGGRSTLLNQGRSGVLAMNAIGMASRPLGCQGRPVPTALHMLSCNDSR